MQQVGAWGVAASALPAVLEVSDAAANGVAFSPGDVSNDAAASYFVFDLEYAADVSAVLSMEFWRAGDDKPSLHARIGLLPRVPTRLAIPLGVLDGQTLFLPRTPLRLKATLQGRRLPLAELDRVVIGLLEASAGSRLRLLSPPRVEKAEPEYPPVDRLLVDELGQSATRAWPGKTAGAASLVQNLRSRREAAARPVPANASRTQYGGSANVRFEATGRFRAHRDGARWWLVDPDGGAFFSAGVDCVRCDEMAAVLPGTERNFAWLPDQSDDRFHRARASRPGMAGFGVAFQVANLIRAFDADWFAGWRDLTAHALGAAGFNTVGNWSDLQFARTSGLPYVVPMPAYNPKLPHLFRSLPDVFDPAYTAGCDAWAEWLAPLRSDERLIGYFLTNEPEWAFGKHNLASEILEAAPHTHTRRALAAFLRTRYPNDAAWAAAWNAGERRTESVVTDVWRRAEDRSRAAYDDLFAFSRLIVRQWVAPMATACARVLPGVLNLGTRWAWISSDLCYEVAEFCDVFTINNYDFEPPLSMLSEVSQRTGRPVMIGEFHHGATDRGLPSTGIKGVPTTRDRGVAYRRYVEQCAAHPACVGCHYFQYADQPILGRFDGENYNIGLVDVCLTPYAELLDAARQTHDRLYDLATGEALPIAEKAPRAPGIFF